MKLKIQIKWIVLSCPTNAIRMTGTTKLQIVPFCTDNQQLEKKNDVAKIRKHVKIEQTGFTLTVK